MRRAGALALAALILAPGAASAHAFPRPYDLPLPLGYWLAAAGAAVALSFLAAAGLIRRAGPIPERLVPLPAWTPAAVAALRGLSVAVFGLLVAAGLFGDQSDWDRNILPVAIWVVWWVGMGFVCALIGDLWALVNPWAAVALAVRRLRGARVPRFRLPEWVGAWPAVALFLAFAWIELVWPSNAVPRRLAQAILAYSALTWAGMALFGIETWLRRGEVFARVFGLFGRFAPIAGRGSSLVLRPPGAGLAEGPLPSLSDCALVVALLATVSFDGFAETPAWAHLSGAAMGALYQAGVVGALGYVGAQSLVKTLGLVAAPLVFAGLYLAACGLTARLARRPLGEIARGFVLTLLPIAIGYHLAHYFSYLIVQGQMILPLASDPFGFGWDLLGLRGRGLDLDAVDMRLVWAVAVAGVTAGHAAGVLLAHRAALVAGLSLAAQLPLVGLMIGYTVASLWILSLPITAH